MWRVLSLSLLFSLSLVECQTPVIGGSCSVGSNDVQIGGKQTQFYLKCEQTTANESGEGVWVVKSRSAASSPSVPLENSQANHRPAVMHKQPNICEQDFNSREGESCVVSTTCLQSHSELPSSYLQCEQTRMMWLRRDCHEGTIFNFEQQACIVPKRVHSLSRQTTSGLICTYSSCSNSNPCNVGTCNNGYCCSSSSSIPQTATIAFCPNGGYSSGSCNSYSGCSSGYSCQQGSCCPSYSSNTVSFSCPGGSSPIGSCVNGGCASGYQCQNNYCCASQNPFVCIDGTQAVGSCVNGVCGTGYTCNNGLCCSSSSATPRCLDGSPAVGACIPSCTGDMCGGVTVTYSCGSGYTCTTGNICCQTSTCPLGGTPIGPPVNGLCPSGYTLQGNQCCSSTNQCTNGGTYVGDTVNGACPTGTVLSNGVCCTGGAITCAAADSTGPCIAGQTLNCGPGSVCDTTSQLCCPVLNNVDTTNLPAIGPAIGGACPIGYFIVTSLTGEQECVSIQALPGICTEAQQEGPCNPTTGACSTGFECYIAGQVCCQTGTSTQVMRRYPTNNRRNNPFLVSHLML